MMSKPIKQKDFDQIITLINDAKQRVYVKANTELVTLYYNIGKIVSDKVNQGNWGENTVQELADFITSKQPKLTGFNRRGLYRMKQFYETYANPQFLSVVADQLQSTENKEHEKVSPLVTQILNEQKLKVTPVVSQIEKKENQIESFVKTMLIMISWSNHLLILSKTKTNEEKLFYMSHTVIEKLGKRELERQLNSSVYERTMLSNKAITNPHPYLPQNLFKDPYIFEFLDLPESYTEHDFEKSIILNLKKFILEIGHGFTYMGNQYRLQVGNKDFYTDLLFYHRDLQCLVLFELKIQDFEPEFLGKLNFYLEALDRDVKRPNENPSIGILLCKGKETEVVEYAMARNISPAIVADYETKLIDRKILTDKLHQLVELLSKKED
jgi:predicted nuclease of restriction endonuclease-like (RecB) superfamily